MTLELVSAAAALASLGMSPGTTGNVSVRSGDTIVMSPTGASLASLSVDELAILEKDGSHRSGGTPSKEVPLHAAFYERDLSTRAVVHLHSPEAMAVSCIAPWSEQSALPPVSPYFVMKVGRTPLVGYAPPGDSVLADLIRRMPGRFRAVLLQNHGLVVAGTSLDAAVETAIELEQACRLWLAVRVFDPLLLTREAALELAERFDSPWES